ncbi:ABC transporter substrate-binding protein [Candidatus Methanodesulfokora washburnensis]|jgi:branched-chain amino acid transport system substrate-binding protein|uniref:Amino acid ABC transporter substrate-binding protein n=1 Tax=Candidatus Methanodesulfokora washburnensis TaxID=2478471 RepID=A0A429GP64_9CREN|nr:ABC transporter substrate-binding protein [Candidatus Methanodesulfokores washburnensis]RSN75549.1 amino acid ABC transporter substrate-binding protein [Candidatus Methanodesulfokores washburnensis]
MNGRGITTPVLAVLLIVVLLVGIGIGYAIPKPAPAAPTPTPTPAPTGLPKEIPIGVPLPLSGDFASYGARGKAVAELAEKDINDFVKSVGLPLTFKFYYEDTETKSDVTLQKVQTFAAKGIKVIVGLLSSADIQAIKGYVDANKIVVITSFSTVAELGAPDYIFRLIPHDDMEGVALARLVYGLGITHVAILQRKDPCDISIAHSFRDEFKRLGGEILAYIEYEPGTSEFSSEIAALETAIGPAIQKYGADKVAIQTLTWEDLAMTLAQAKARNSITLSVRWFGGDAIAMSSVILRDAGDVAVRTQLLAGFYYAPETPKKEKVVKYVKEKTGEDVDIYSLILYDCLWVAAMSVLQAGTYDGAIIQKMVPYVANSYFGASGWTEIDENGDRKGLDMAFYQVKTVDGKPKWVLVAKYISATGAVSWG